MSAGFMLRPTEFLEACAADCGDFFTLRPAPGRQVVFTSDPATVRQVFTGDPALLHAGAGNVTLAPLLGPGSVLLLDGAEHLRHRKLLLPPFHGDRMRGHADVMREVAERHVARWPREGAFAVLPSMQAMTLEIILRVVFGVSDPVARQRLGDPLRVLLEEMASPARLLALGLTGSRRSGPLSPWRRFARLRALADARVHEEITRRRADPDAAGRDDVFSMLVAARDEQGRALTDDELRDELMTLLVAGHETTATALAWTLERIVRHPDVHARLLAEQAAGGTAYLDAVIRETLRLRPVVPAVVRELQAPMTFDAWDLPAGVSIAPSIYLLHRRADLYPEPLAFRPERFLDRAPGTYEWIPFGGSVRRCLGASFALLEMRELLGVVLREVPLRAVGRGDGEATRRRTVTFAPADGGRVLVGA
jgi:cytochrome P450